MRYRRSRWKVETWAVAVAIVAGLAAFGVSLASAQDTTAGEGAKAVEGATAAERAKAAKDTTSTGNRVFFRGGAAGLTSDRAGELVTDLHTGLNDGSIGYYIGGGTDLMISRDLWGMMNGTALVGEIGLEFKRWSSSSVPNLDGLTGAGPAKVQMTMFTASVSPKVKFRQGTDFQPWVIPAGLDFHVISPTSSQINYLDIGVQFGGGAEFRVWKELWLGIDSRFHLASNQTNTVNNFWTAGVYGAIGF